MLVKLKLHNWTLCVDKNKRDAASFEIEQVSFIHMLLNMDSGYEKHPADQKAAEIIAMIPNYYQQMTSNNEYVTSSSLSHASSRRFSIISDICYELDLREVKKDRLNRNDVTEPLQKCPHCNTSLLDKPPIYPTSLSLGPLGCERELHFIRAVIWMKSAMKTMRDVSASDMCGMFGGQSPIDHSRNSWISSPGKLDIDLVMQDSKNTKNVQLQETCIPDNKYLIPNEEDGQSQISNKISFDEDSDQEDTANSVMPIDSGIAMSDCISNASRLDYSRVKQYKGNESMVSIEVGKSCKRPVNEQVKKNYCNLPETISSASIANLIENLRLNNFVLGEIRVVLSVLEKDEIAKNYMKNGAMIRNAIDTIVQFLNQLVTENDMSSSAVYLRLCIENIMTTVRKVFKRKTHMNLNSAERQFQLISIIGFCNCRKVCEEIIDLLIRSLTEIMNEDLDDYEDPQMINDSEAHILCRILQTSVHIYSEIVGPSRMMETNLHHYTTFIWRGLWKNYEQYESPEFQARELEIEWVRRLENLIDPESPMGLSLFGDYKAIVNAIKILSSPPLGQT